MKPAYKFILVLICLTFLIVIGSCVNGSLQLIVPTIPQLVIAAVCLSMLYVASGLIFVKGAKHALFLLGPYILLFLLLEGGTRIWLAFFVKPQEQLLSAEQLRSPDDLGKETVYVPHHYTLYNLRPNLSREEGTVHNSLGLRDSRQFSSNDGIIRVVFIGGSTTYTIAIKDNKKIFSYGLEQRLNEYYHDKLTDYKIQVINAGMGGATSAENLLRLIFFVSDISPDLVVIQHGLNDVWTRTTSAPIQSDFGNYRKAWSRPREKYSFFSKDRPIISALALTGIQHSMFMVYTLRRIGYSLPNYQHYDEEQGKMTNILSVGALVNRSDVEMHERYLAQNSTKYFERNTRYMIAICRSMGAEVLLVTEPYTEKAGKARNIAMPDHNALLARIAREEGVLFYDFAKEMIKDDAHMPDGKHMSQIGSDLKRDLFFEYFLKQNIIPKLRTAIQSRVNIANKHHVKAEAKLPFPLSVPSGVKP